MNIMIKNLYTITILTSIIFTTLLATQSDYQDKLLLHIIPHSHNDAGWLATFDEYYNGINTPYQECVKCILDNMVPVLDNHPNRTFIYAEMAFFEKWFYLQNDQIKQKVRDLVKNHSLSFPNGGWVMNDEACAYYDDIIEQMILGHRFLAKEFNYIPKVGWHIDPFGHSSAQASLFSQMGFNMFFIERVDMQDLAQREIDKNYEFIWKGNDILEENYILTHINHIKYGNWFQEYNLGKVYVTNRNLLKLVQYYHDEHKYYKTNNSFALFGDDFSFSTNAQILYTQIQNIVRQINNYPLDGIKAVLSTPDNYSSTWYEDYLLDENIKLNIKKDDFFPVSDRAWFHEPGYWTGYFTSKASFKLNVKIASQYLNNFRKIYAKYLLNIQDNHEKYNKIFNIINLSLGQLERAISISQHHDAIAGTAKDRVMQDYLLKLNQAINVNLELINQISNDEINQNFNESIATFDICNANSSSYQCEQSFRTIDSNGSTFIRIFNPGNMRKLVIRLKIPHKNIELIDENNTLVYNEKICFMDQYYNTNKDDCDLYFEDTFPAFTYKNYKIINNITATNILDSISYDTQAFPTKILKIDDYTNFTIYEDLKTFEISHCKNETFNVKSNPNDCLNQQFNIDYMYYKSVAKTMQSSGAYIFRPYTSIPYEFYNPAKITIIKGDFVTQIKIQRDNIVSNKPQLITRINLYKNSFDKGIEIESHIFPVKWNQQSIISDISDIGREIIMKIKVANLANRNIFYTDSNGMQMMERVYNYKPEYDPDLIGNTATGNYYPIGSAIYIEDSHSGDRFTIMNDRAQGGSSLHKGEIEIMIHRRILSDDNRGLGEFLDETETIKDANNSDLIIPISVRTNHIIQFSNIKKNFTSYQRDIQYNRDNSPLILYGNSLLPNFTTGMLKDDIISNNDDEYLPKRVKISIRSYTEGEYIIRLHNLDDEKSIKLNMLDNNFNIILTKILNKNQTVKTDSISELSLSTNQLKSTLLREKYIFRELNNLNLDDLITNNYSVITLRPQEIRTFLLSNISKLDGIFYNINNNKRNEISRNISMSENNKVLANSSNDDNKTIINQQNYTSPHKNYTTEHTINDLKDNDTHNRDQNISLNLTHKGLTNHTHSKNKTFELLIDKYYNNSSDIVIVQAILIVILAILLAFAIRTIYKKQQNNNTEQQNYEEMHNEVPNPFDVSEDGA